MILSSISEIAETLWFRAMFSLLSGEKRMNFLRGYGVKIGKHCEIHATHFSTEPYLIEIGDHVGIAAGTMFITHDGSVRILRDKYPELDHFGTIKIGSNTFIGSNCMLLPNTSIGSNCIVGAGSVVRGIIPDNSVIMGNPARVIMRTSLASLMFASHKNSLNTKSLTKKDKTRIIKNHFGITR